MSMNMIILTWLVMPGLILYSKTLLLHRLAEEAGLPCMDSAFLLTKTFPFVMKRLESITQEFVVFLQKFGGKDKSLHIWHLRKNRVGQTTVFQYCFSGADADFVHIPGKSLMKQNRNDFMEYIPLLTYSFQWNIEVSYYEQKCFWSLCHYMDKYSASNLINVSYCAMKRKW